MVVSSGKCMDLGMELVHVQVGVTSCNRGMQRDTMI